LIVTARGGKNGGERLGARPGKQINTRLDVLSAALACHSLRVHSYPSDEEMAPRFQLAQHRNAYGSRFLKKAQRSFESVS